MAVGFIFFELSLLSISFFISLFSFVQSSKVTIKHWCAGKIAALLRAFGLRVGLCGLANVLQCAWAVDRCFPLCAQKAQGAWAKKIKPLA